MAENRSTNGSGRADSLFGFGSRFNPWFGIHRTAAARREHAEVLRRSLGDMQDCSEIRFLQDQLDLLDEKASGLVQFNSILLAVLSILVTWMNESELLGLALDLGILLCISSCAMCLSIIYVFWLRTETIVEQDLQTYGVQLLWLRDRRTIVYRIAWWLAIAALADLGMIIVAHLVSRAVLA